MSSIAKTFEPGPAVTGAEAATNPEMVAMIRRVTGTTAEAEEVPPNGWDRLKQVTRSAAAPRRPHRDAARNRKRTRALAITIAVFAVVPLHLLAILALLVLLACAGLAWGLGYDRIRRMVLARFHAIQAADPARAEALRLRAAGLSRRLDHMLGYLPDRWTRGLYLPDFEPEEAPEAFSADPFDRLERGA